MVISEPTQFVAGRFAKPLRFASNQQMQINIFSFFKKKKPIHAVLCGPINTTRDTKVCSTK